MEWLHLLQRFLSDFLRGAGVTLELTAVGLALRSGSFSRW